MNKILESHIPIVRARFPSKKLSTLKKITDENIDKMTKTFNNFNFAPNKNKSNTNNNNNEDYEDLISANNLAFSEVFEISPHKESLSPSSKKKPQEFPLKTGNSLENQRINSNIPIFKRKSAVMIKPFQFIREENNRIKMLPVDIIKNKEELFEKIKKRNIENHEKNTIKATKTENDRPELETKRKNHAKSKLTEAFQKAEIYNDKVVRQLNFEKDNQEEEKNFQEMFEVLNNMNR